MAATKKTEKKAVPSPDAHMLAKYEHHRGMAEKHRAHADLIEAKLKVQGKRIAHDYGHSVYPSDAKPAKRKIVKDV
jgi:hypothetical protein